ncbi:hypothetical protein [Aeromonas sp. MrichA-1]|uniref:hypothetical protein n=1 Tax=Aeromonas sp. MrichA-1 TaxID=2823362 RepID=UPI001B3439BE|nr:hypothetical protein [Aeromonas sp. MrichA-1]MBP4081375.1 hypothetical protein [Aeromonas sp. MrichA-1]
MNITILDALRNVLALAKEHAVTGEDNDSVKLLGLLLTGTEIEPWVNGKILNEQDLQDGETSSYSATGGTHWDKLKSLEEVAIGIRTGDLSDVLHAERFKDRNAEYRKLIEITIVSKI